MCLTSGTAPRVCFRSKIKHRCSAQTVEMRLTKSPHWQLPTLYQLTLWNKPREISWPCFIYTVPVYRYYTEILNIKNLRLWKKLYIFLLHFTIRQSLLLIVFLPYPTGNILTQHSCLLRSEHITHSFIHSFYISYKLCFVLYIWYDIPPRSIEQE